MKRQILRSRLEVLPKILNDIVQKSDYPTIDFIALKTLKTKFVKNPKYLKTIIRTILLIMENTNITLMQMPKSRKLKSKTQNMSN